MLPRGRQDLAPRIGNRFRQSLNPGGISAYLPTLYGSFPIWHQADLADGSVATWTDCSIAKQITAAGAAQPTKGSGKVTFSTDDVLSTSDAALCAYPDNLSGWTFWAIAELNSGTPLAEEVVFGWASTVDVLIYARGSHSTGDKLTTLRRSGGAAMTHTSTANMDGTAACYVWQGAGGSLVDTISSYLNGTITAAAVGPTAQTNTTTNRFGVGALQRATASLFFNGSIYVCGALNRVLTAGEMTALQAYFTAGFPR